MLSLKAELKTNEKQIRQLYENLKDLEGEAQMWHDLSKENAAQAAEDKLNIEQLEDALDAAAPAVELVSKTLAVDESEVDSEDFKLRTPPELGGEPGYELAVPPELGGAPEAGLEASVEGADVSALRTQLATARAELEKSAARRYEIFFIAENDPKLSVEGRVELYK